MRELLKQYLTEKQNGCLRSGRLREAVAYGRWSLTRSGRNERVECITFGFITVIIHNLNRTGS